MQPAPVVRPRRRRGRVAPRLLFQHGDVTSPAAEPTIVGPDRVRYRVPTGLRDAPGPRRPPHPRLRHSVLLSIMSTPLTRHVGARAFALVPMLVVLLRGTGWSPDFGDLATNHGYVQATGDHVFFLQWVKKDSSISGTFEDDDPSTGNGR